MWCTLVRRVSMWPIYARSGTAARFPRRKSGPPRKHGRQDASQGHARCPCCASLLLSRALSFGLGHSTGCRERALKVSSVEFNVDKIRTAATPDWNNPHANLDPTNSPTQFELSSDALCKVCTRVLLDSVPLPLHPDPLIPLTQLIDDKASQARGSTDLAWRPTADLCVISFLEPTTITD